MGKILVIDDDLEICETLNSLVIRKEHLCDTVQSIQGARRVLADGNYDVVFLDVRLPDGSGLDLLPDCVSLPKAPEVIILTGKGDAAGAELAIGGGAWDYVLKPSSVRELSATLDRALKYHSEKQENIRHREMNTGGIIGKSSEMQKAFVSLFQAADSDVSVLITGETGTGKEVFARTIHNNSARKDKGFVVVDCASLTESLLESTLFGHRKGAFTGAHENQQGLIKTADGGTLFLDELGEMPLSLQKSFLRVLQEHTFRAIGDSKEQTSDFRLIAATNRNLDQMVAEGSFRSDLLYRIKGMTIHLAPLRSRPGDVHALAEHRLQQHALQHGGEVKEPGSCFRHQLELYEWPGNVRELFNIVDRAVIAAGSEQKLYGMHLPQAMRIQVTQKQILSRIEEEKEVEKSLELGEEPPVRKTGRHPLAEALLEDLPPLKEYKNVAERLYIAELIARTESDVPEILKKSGLSRSHFYSLVKKHGLFL